MFNQQFAMHLIFIALFASLSTGCASNSSAESELEASRARQQAAAKVRRDELRESQRLDREAEAAAKREEERRANAEAQARAAERSRAKSERERANAERERATKEENERLRKVEDEWVAKTRASNKLDDALKPAYEEAKKAVLVKLKAPATAIFPASFDFHRVSFDGLHVLEFHVDAQNGFGALIRKTASVKLKRFESGWFPIFNSVIFY